MIKLFQIKWYRYIWEFPQILVGLVLLGFYKWKDPDHFGMKEYKDSFIAKSLAMKGGISLGPYIIIDWYDNSQNTILHEYGHCRQSKMLGPFYLLVIGLSSLTHVIIRDCMKKKCNYYHFFTEKWADKLGGVNRS